jgi:hypothetical protein
MKKTLLQELYTPFNKRIKLLEYPEQYSLPLNHNTNDQHDEKDLWDYENIEQEFDSADTSLNQVPATFNYVDSAIGWKPGTLLDIGGGKSFTDEFGNAIHKFTQALASKMVKVSVYDPFNQTFEHNMKVAAEIKKHGADYVSCNNVLNTIFEPQIRNRVIRQAYAAVKDGPDNYAFFLIYQGNKSRKGKMTKVSKDGTKKSWQNNRPAADYVSEIKAVFPKVFTIKTNLIIAQK